MRPVHLLLTALLSTLNALSAADSQPMAFGMLGLEGRALPPWPKTADTIHITKCEEGSPAAGKLKVGDVITGIAGEKFSKHPIIELANILDQVEASDGKLPLLLQDGSSVTLDLPQLGAYSASAPYHCKKTDLIIQQTAQRLMQEKALGSSPTRTGLLGLMATGEAAHLEAVRNIIHSSDILKVDPVAVDQYLKTGQPDMGSTGWTWGYNCIALGEYYLLTKDETVLPALRTYALGLARGQDAIGLWGHRMATEARKGRAAGYGIMNAASIPNFVGMLIARKCGIEDPILDQAIETTYAYVADHVEKGGFPYGVHGPASDQFNNNGSSGSAAISMALMGNQEGAAYFSKVCIPTHNALTVGHASHFFNPLWTPLGASLSGPEATQEFFERSLWYFNGKRDWKGGFPGQGRGGFYGGQALLTYCLPRKVLLITGREADESIWIRDRKEIDRLIEMNLVKPQDRSEDELLVMLRDPIIQERVKAASELSNRLSHKWRKQLGKDPISPKLLADLKNGSDQQKIMALQVLGGVAKGPASQFAETFAAVVNAKEESLAVRTEAALAFRNCGAAAFPYLNDILKLALEERTEPDPFGHVDTRIARGIEEIFRGLDTPESREGLNMDKNLRYRVARQFLTHPRQKVRSVGTGLLEDIPLEDFHLVGEELIHVLNNDDPSYHTYSNALDANGISVLADLNIKDGLDYLEYGIFHGDGKWGFKYGSLIKTLPKYGANAAPYIPIFEAHKDINKPGDRFTPKWQEAVKKIREDKNPKKLITAKEAIKIGKKE